MRTSMGTMSPAARLTRTAATVGLGAALMVGAYFETTQLLLHFG
jgi:hypothetical protein